MTNLLLSFLLSALLVILFMPVLKSILRKINAKQTVLKYVEEHKSKNGTLTMGGVCFLLSTLIVPFLFLKIDTDWLVCLLATIFFGLIGLMDDYLKIKFKQNLGLRPYQKIIGQFGIAIIFALFVYFNVGSEVFIPFTTKTIDLGFWIIPLIIVVLIASTNSANLMDGMDGLLSTTSIVYLMGFVVIVLLVSNGLYFSGETGRILDMSWGISTIAICLIGGLCGFLLFNSFPASIFMGDVGSLLIGGFIGCSASILGQVLLLPILGLLYVWTTLSVIIQVAVFKKTKRRIFKMSPFHHHLQQIGLSEPKIVYLYSFITAIVGVVCIIFYLL